MSISPSALADPRCSVFECAEAHALNDAGDGDHYTNGFTPAIAKGTGELIVDEFIVDWCTFEQGDHSCWTSGHAPSHPGCTTVEAETTYLSVIADEDRWCPDNNLLDRVSPVFNQTPLP